jgi:flagellar basal body P-ring formation protein FlgA
MSGRLGLIISLALYFCAPPLHAQEVALPVPRAVIYPGDVLTDALLDDRAVNPEDVGLTHIRSRAALLGKVARRTLLPGQPIPASAVDQQRLVTVGAQVKIVYSEGGLQIVAFGLAQQAGGAGDLVRVRNLDSGLFVMGRVQNDGSIRVGEG